MRSLIPAWAAPAQPGAAARKPSFIESTLLGCTIEQSPRLVPGVLLAIGIVIASVVVTNWVSQFWSYEGVISYIMTAIIIGMIVRNVFGMHVVFRPGINFSLNSLLKLGIILMGIRLSISELVSISAWGFPIIVGCILIGLVVTTYFTRLLNLPDRLGTLIAVGTSICGSSAILATAPAIDAKDDEVAYAIANITIFGILAMFTYPYVADILFEGDLIQVGLFTGTAIHNTAQVAAAGLIYDQTFPVVGSTTATDVSVIAKLVRNALMVAVVPGMAFMYARRMASSAEGTEQKKLGVIRFIPLFVVGFVIMAALRSVGDASLVGGSSALGIWDSAAWGQLIGSLKDWAGYLLAVAMAGVGLGTSLKSMRGLGMKPFIVGLVSATVVGITSILLVILIGPLVEL